ncbi:MAG: hypothetical protein ACRD2L_00435 [Terriglobia bacterium]
MADPLAALLGQPQTSASALKGVRSEDILGANLPAISQFYGTIQNILASRGATSPDLLAGILSAGRGTPGRGFLGEATGQASTELGSRLAAEEAQTAGQRGAEDIDLIRRMILEPAATSRELRTRERYESARSREAQNQLRKKKRALYTQFLASLLGKIARGAAQTG